MALRLFSCSNCNHRLRFGQTKCSRCYSDTPMSNRWSVIILGALMILGVVIILLA